MVADAAVAAENVIAVDLLLDLDPGDVNIRGRARKIIRAAHSAAGQARCPGVVASGTGSALT
jgi:hypothetical protein